MARVSAPLVRPTYSPGFDPDASWYDRIEQYFRGQGGVADPSTLPAPTGFHFYGKKGDPFNRQAVPDRPPAGPSRAPAFPVAPAATPAATGIFPGYGEPLDIPRGETDPFAPQLTAGMQIRPAALNDYLAQNAMLPVGNTGALNANQDGMKQSESLQRNLKAIQDARKEAKIFGFTEKGQDLASAGFVREPGRTYNVERDAAGNIIGMQANRKRQGSRMEDITPEELAAKSWSPQSKTGDPFTPNLSKFRARQDEESLKTADFNEQTRRQQALADASAKVRAQQAERDERLKTQGLKMNPDGSVTKADQSAPVAGTTTTPFKVDTSKQAADTLAQGKEKAEGMWTQAENLSNAADAMRQDRAKRIGQQGMSTMADYSNAKQEQAARDASSNLIKQGTKAFSTASQQATALGSAPKTEGQRIEGQYGTGVASSTGAPLGKAYEQATGEKKPPATEQTKPKQLPPEKKKK